MGSKYSKIHQCVHTPYTLRVLRCCPLTGSAGMRTRSEKEQQHYVVLTAVPPPNFCCTKQHPTFPIFAFQLFWTYFVLPFVVFEIECSKGSAASAGTTSRLSCWFSRLLCASRCRYNVAAILPYKRYVDYVWRDQDPACKDSRKTLWMDTRFAR